jgi:signal recognition particle subunit SEC65
MIVRNILADDIIEVIEYGEIIVEYPNDKPYPSRLLLNFIKGKAIHVVVAQNSSSKQCIIITCYFPDPALWDKDFKIKIK